MKKIFCLETEWSQGIDDMTHESAVKSLLNFVANDNGLEVPSCFRQVATYWDFEYYLNHLQEPEYDCYDMVYLCFHGSCGKISFANDKRLSLKGIARNFPHIFEGRIVHFDSCSTLDVPEEEILTFKQKTGARIVSGFSNDVDFTNSFIFELWLMSTLKNHPQYGARALNRAAKEQMSWYVDQLGFMAY